MVWPGVEPVFQSVSWNRPWYLPVECVAENPAPKARKSLAQHGAAGGVLGKVENKFESRGDGTVPATDNRVQQYLAVILID